jgi:predicted phosphodiesterase
MTNAILTQWTYHGTDGTAFLWERSTDAGSTWPLKMAFPFTASSYLDADVSLYGKYWYKIAAANPKGTGSFSSLAFAWVKPPDPQLYVWQNGSGSSATAFWNYQGPASMSLSRSSNGGTTWPLTAVITPTSGSTYYYIDPTVSVGQTYSYRLQDLGNTSLPYYDITPVVINPPSPVTVMAFTADSGFETGAVGDVPWEIHTASVLDMNNQIRGRFSASRMLLGGDNGYTNINFHQGYQGQCFSLFGPSESIWAVMGNHDVSDMGGVTRWQNYFGTPANYTRTEGPTQIFGLYTISSVDATYASGSAQWLVLSQSLSASLNDPSVAWRVAMVHVPTVSSTYPHLINSYLAAIPWRQWGVDVVLCGHNHIVERCESSSVAFITCGVGGSHKQGYPMTARSPYSQWTFTDANNGSYDYCSGYVYQLIQATDTYMSLSFYSSSVKLPDTGPTNIFNAVMAGNSLVLRKMPPQAVPSLIASTSSI